VNLTPCVSWQVLRDTLYPSIHKRVSKPAIHPDRASPSSRWVIAGGARGHRRAKWVLVNGFWLPFGYYLERDADLLILRRSDNSLVAAFSAEGVDLFEVELAVWEDADSVNTRCRNSGQNGTKYVACWRGEACSEPLNK